MSEDVNPQPGDLVEATWKSHSPPEVRTFRWTGNHPASTGGGWNGWKLRVVERATPPAPDPSGDELASVEWESDTSGLVAILRVSAGNYRDDMCYSTPAVMRKVADELERLAGVQSPPATPEPARRDPLSNFDTWDGGL